MLYIFIHARLRINLWQKTKFINGNSANSGNQPRRAFDAGLLQGINEGERGRGEGKTAAGFLPSHIALYSIPPSPPAPVCPAPRASGHQCPFEDSLPPLHLWELVQTRLQMCSAFLATLQNKGQTISAAPFHCSINQTEFLWCSYGCHMKISLLIPD